MVLRMADSIDPAALPAGMDAYAGYVGGRWPDFQAIAARETGARLLSVAIAADEDADCLDVENGDATAFEAPAWAARQAARGLARPCVYTSVMNAALVMSTMAGAGWPRSAYRLLTAHYGAGTHICGPRCGGSDFAGTADGTQWVDHGGWDESLLADSFFDDTVPGSPLAPTPLKEEDRMALTNDGKAQYLITVDATGKLRKTPLPPGTNLQALLAAGVANWGEQAALVADIAAAG